MAHRTRHSGRAAPRRPPGMHRARGEYGAARFPLFVNSRPSASARAPPWAGKNTGPIIRRDRARCSHTCAPGRRRRRRRRAVTADRAARRPVACDCRCRCRWWRCGWWCCCRSPGRPHALAGRGVGRPRTVTRTRRCGRATPARAPPTPPARHVLAGRRGSDGAAQTSRGTPPRSPAAAAAAAGPRAGQRAPIEIDLSSAAAAAGNNEMPGYSAGL